MGAIFMFIFLIPFFYLAYFGIHYGVPIVNRVLSFIWEDPSVKQRNAIARRLKELHVDGNVPSEVAVLLAAKEFNATEEKLIKTAGLLDAGEIMGMLTGKRSPAGVFLNGINKALKRR
jgi:hypothetical protein